jgi:hypothetical protein
MKAVFSENAGTYVLLLLAVLLFSFDGTLLLLLSQSNLSQWTIIFWRQLFQLCILTIVYLSSLLIQKKDIIKELTDKFSSVGVW